ncbi:type II toxin-antitoxin system VapC family toxin [Bosea sp. (in: a-proteobacteria)]|uniref:type II toxin-antitoxin system VapC family toxin n=1 Tax=Bosea sp. (in: a-proteobacteria) TaxID=1871050 RepID=UPI002736E09F|nr:type II toxin-antitoxin system VapC family toxin [Bosea sp. (in: a-proteobacteria)]MDP3411076.1 type II toxin-antitoxin system VapC family toxin [Bosea sp. (in: a-proteobacteria)]
MAYLIDTNVVSELTKRAPSLSVVDFLRQSSDLFISVIVFHELEYGIHGTADAERRAKLQAYALSLRQQFAGRIIDVDLQLAETAGRLRAFERSTGRILAELDALIAATAMVRGYVLVTRNIKDFETLSIPLLNPWDSVE